MTLVPVPLGPYVDKAQKRQGGGVTLSNCYVETTKGGKSEFSLNCDPGLGLWALVAPNENGRGGVLFGSALYCVFGEVAYKVQISGIATTLGAVLGSAHCIFSINRKSPNNQITITADTKNYVIENDVLSEVTDTDLPSGVHSNCYLDGRTIYGLPDGRWFASADNDSTSVTGTSFAEAERDSDAGVRVAALGEEFWYWGERSLEIWRSSGDSVVPFSPLLGAGQGEGAGSAAKHSHAVCAGAFFWVNDKKNVVRAEGYAPRKISTHEVDRDIETAVAAGLNAEILGFSLTIEGHDLYILRCPLWCWCYDTTYDAWHKKFDYLQQTWRCGFYIYAFGKHLLGDVTTGKIYEQSFASFRYETSPIPMKVVTSPLDAFPEGYSCSALHLDIQRGVGLAGGADEEENPQVLLRVSRDGGMTFGREYRRPMGAQGKWLTSVRFNRLGAAGPAGMVFELSFPASVKRAVFKATADLEKRLA